MFLRKFKKRKTDGNSMLLLKDGDEFFPRILRQIRSAKVEILIETFILADDRIGKALKKALISAARNGVRIIVTADSYGSFFLPKTYINELISEGITFQIYDPQPTLLGFRPKIVRRLHRKIIVIDNKIAHIGGINLCEDHMVANNTTGKRDYSLEMSGPIVTQVRELSKSYITGGLPDIEPESYLTSAQDERYIDNVEGVLLSRDNIINKRDIEKAYLMAIRTAEKSILIANAYFYPGLRLLRALKRAANRGVEIKIVVQGDPDIPSALPAARCFYKTLLKIGVQIFEYSDRPLHGKIACVDDKWCTIGSSNLDPWSLAMNLEANIVALDHRLNAQIKDCVEQLIKHSEPGSIELLGEQSWLTQITYQLFYSSIRWVPVITRWIPNPRPNVLAFKPGQKNAEIRELETSNQE